MTVEWYSLILLVFKLLSVVEGTRKPYMKTVYLPTPQNYRQIQPFRCVNDRDQRNFGENAFSLTGCKPIGQPFAATEILRHIERQKRMQKLRTCRAIFFAKGMSNAQKRRLSRRNGCRRLMSRFSKQNGRVDSRLFATDENALSPGSANQVGKKNQNLDPEVDMTTPEIIDHWGYPVEEHQVTTEDGYILEIHRIPHGKNRFQTSNERKVVFLMHGLVCSSADWVINAPELSAGFMFADAGFDVWLGNVRGNTYGKHHTRLSPGKQEFWQFSWDEIAKYDLEAMINFAVETSGVEKLYYVAHSQGTLTGFAKFSEEPSFARMKIKKFFALAPVARNKNTQGLMHWLSHYFLTQAEFLLKHTGQREFLPSNLMTNLFAKGVCGWAAPSACVSLISAIAGPDTGQIDSRRTPVYFAHTPAGTSTQNIIHIAQTASAGKFQKYDYMSETENMRHYGQATPPEYDLSKMEVETYLYWSTEDKIVDPGDVEWLLARIKNLEVQIPLTDFNHLDFIWGNRAAEEIYKGIVTIIINDAG